MKKFLFFIILILLISLVNCATEPKITHPEYISQEKCDAPVWNVGDSWRYKYDNKREWEHRVLGIEQFKNSQIYIVEDVYGVYNKGFDVKTLQLKVDIGPDGKKIVPMTDWGTYYDFPLYVGKKWEKMASGTDAGKNPRNYLFTYKVISYENVTVPSGTFKAFKIERNQRDFTISGNIITYLWYSPEVKSVIKFQYGPADGRWRIEGQGYELQSFRLMDKQLPEKLQTITPIISPPVTSMVIVTGSSANIRSGSGNEFPITTTVKQGDKLILLGEKEDWFNVRLENGQEGWINNKFVK